MSDLKALPALPHAVARLVSALMNEEVEVADIEQIVRQDEALGMAVLRTANSALHGSPDRVFTLSESINRLGFSTLRGIALSHQVSTLLSRPVRGYGLDRGQLWRGSVGGALAAETIAQDVTSIDPGLAFVAGLLRDCGKLAMEGLLGASDLEAAFCDEHEDTSQPAYERSICGFDHAEVGFELAKIWKLPDQICDAIRHHHAPPEVDEGRDILFDVVHAGDIVCVWMGLGIGHDGTAYELDKTTRKVLSLDRTAVEGYLATTRHRLDELIGVA